MSSTRGEAKRTGGKFDAFPTPAWCVDRLLERWRPPLNAGAWVEPAAGDGAIIRAVSAVLAPLQWFAYEIRGECTESLLRTGATVSISDYLAADLIGHERVVMTNPPYARAEAFVRQSRRLFPRADIVMLLRQGFLSSAERVEMYRDVGVPDLYVLPDRPDFLGTGGSDSADYAWFVWSPDKRSRGSVEILNATPLRVRRPERIPRAARFPKSYQMPSGEGAGPPEPAPGDPREGEGTAVAAATPGPGVSSASPGEAGYTQVGEGASGDACPYGRPHDGGAPRSACTDS